MDNNKIPKSRFILYTTPKGDIRIEVFFQDETVWLTINKMADLFDTSKQNISYHLQNIYADEELSKKSTVKEILTVQKEGGKEAELRYLKQETILIYV